MIQDYLEKHIAWSKETFGEGRKTASISNHIRKELAEIADNPTDLMEWIDVIILGFDGAWRAGYTPGQIFFALQHKQSVNIGRTWQIPDDPDAPIEHVRMEK
jgi:hypothetical protein